MASVHDLTQESGFVFEAQVEQVGASAASGYPAAPETAVVRITSIIKSTPILAGYSGQQVTVHLQAPVSLQAGQQAIFFTHGIHYSDGLVVAEIGNVPAAAATMNAELSSAVQASSESEMTQRLAAADLVVTGVAADPVPVPQAQAGAPLLRRVSEHDPDWWKSTITVETVEKGVLTEKTADFVFPKSMDIVWCRSPKIKAGDHGVFLLHSRDVYGKAVPMRAVTHPLDFRPTGEVGRIRELLK